MSGAGLVAVICPALVVTWWQGPCTTGTPPPLVARQALGLDARPHLHHGHARRLPVELVARRWCWCRCWWAHLGRSPGAGLVAYGLPGAGAVAARRVPAIWHTSTTGTPGAGLVTWGTAHARPHLHRWWHARRWPGGLGCWCWWCAWGAVAWCPVICPALVLWHSPGAGVGCTPTPPPLGHALGARLVTVVP